MIYKELCAGKHPRTKAERGAAERLVQSGLAKKSGYSEYQGLLRPDPDESTGYLWLPNTLVTGTDQGEESPVRRLRSAGDIWTLRLLVDLYHAQNLRDDGGISPQIVRENYERKLVGQRSIFNVWAFKQSGLELFWNGPLIAHRSRLTVEGKDSPIWENVTQLCRSGLLTFVPHLWENGSEQAEVIHAYGIEGIGGEQLEVELGEAANQAGLRMTLESRVAQARFEKYSWLAPIKNTLPDVQLIGVGRLRYRPHTKRTSEWFADLRESAPRWTQIYQDLCPNVEQATNLSEQTASGARA